MNVALLMQIGMQLITALPTIESSVKAASALVSHIHSVSDATQAAEAVATHLPDLLTAIVANTPEAAPKTE